MAGTTLNTITTRNLRKMVAPTDPNVRWNTYREKTLKGFQCVVFMKKGVTDPTIYFEVYKRLANNGPMVRIRIGDAAVMNITMARSKAKEYLADIGKGINPIEKKRQEKLASTTLRTAIGDYLGPTSKLADSSKVTGERLLRQMETHTGKAGTGFLDTPIAKITSKQVTTIHAEHSKQSAACADGFMRVASAAISAHYIDQSDDDDQPRNPIKVLTRRKLWNHVNPKSRHIETEWIGTWWAATAELKPMLTWFLRMGLLTGCRKSELMNLQWKDVDLVEKKMTFRATKNGTDHVLPITPSLASCLPMKPKGDNTGLVFAVTETSIRNGQIKLKKITGRHWAMHDLRRSAASIANRVGINEYTIKRLLNHGRSRRDVALTHYIQFSIEGLAEALTKISDYVFDQVQEHAAKEPADKVPAVDSPKLIASN